MIILFIILALIALLLIAAAFQKNNYLIERSVNVKLSKTEVYNYLKLLTNGEFYNKWVMTDPNKKTTLKGTDGTVGFIYAWNSENKQAGKGEQEIIKLLPDQSIDHEIRFEKPFVAVSFASFNLKTSGDDSTKVTWSYTGLRNYMMKLMHLLLRLEKLLGRDMQTSLDNLKVILEKK